MKSKHAVLVAVSVSVLLFTSVAITGIAFSEEVRTDEYVKEDLLVEGTDVPTWLVGSSWTYEQTIRTELGMEINQTRAEDEYLEVYEEITYTVDAIEHFTLGNETYFGYNVSIDGDVVGGGGTIEFEDMELDINVTDGSIEGYQFMQMSDLAVVEVRQYREMEADIEGMDVPVVVNIETQQNQNYDPPLETLDFPVMIGDEFRSETEMRVWGYMKFRAEGIGEMDQPFDDEVMVESEIEIPEKETVTVPAGEFEAYRLQSSQPEGSRWYSPDVGWFVNESIDTEMGDQEKRLKSYNLPENPNELSIDPSDEWVGEDVTISGQFPGSPNEDVTISIPEGAEPVSEWETTTDGDGNFETEIEVPLAEDMTIAPDEFSSVGFVAEANGEYAVSTLIIYHDNRPMYPNPEDGAQDVSLYPELSVVVGHHEGESMDVTFYDASDDSVIGVDENVASGEYASTTWEALELGVYEWYAVAEDDVRSYESDEWTFETGGPFFEVEITSPVEEDEYVEGDTVEVLYEVNNIGDEADTQNIEFTVHDEEGDRVYEDTHGNIEIGPGATHSDLFEWPVEEGYWGHHDLIIASGDHEYDVGISVIRQSYFEVNVTAPVEYEEFVQGSEVSVEYTIINTGEATGEQTIEFHVDNEPVDTEEIELDGGDERTSTFIWTAEEPGVRELSVHSLDEQDSVSITVLEEAFFEVTIESPEDGSEYEEGETVTLEYTVTNTGQVEGTQEIMFFVDGTEEDTEEVELGARGSEQGQFIWDGSEPGEYLLNVSSEDDYDHITVRVLEDAFFEVTIGSPEDGDEFVEGEEVVVDYKVTNTGEVEDTQLIEFKVDGVSEDSVEVTLDGDEEHEDQFFWTAGSPGNYNFLVESEDEDAGLTVTVLQDAFFEIDLTSPREGDEFEVEDEITVEFEVRNTGDVEGTQDVELYVDGSLITERSVELEADGTHRGEFTWTADEEGEFELSVGTDDDDDSVMISVEDPFPLMLVVIVVVVVVVVLGAVAFFMMKDKGGDEEETQDQYSGEGPF